MKKKILILCTGNSCRSQMAHGFLQSFDPSLYVSSAGTNASGRLNTKAVEVMREAGVDISHHTSDNVNMYLNDEWDYVITVCGGANENCPVFNGKVKHRIHIGFDDPSEATGTPEYIHSEFVRVRNEIRTAFYELYQENILLKQLNERPDDIVICHCGKITLGEIRKAISENYTTIQAVRDYTGKHLTGKCNILSPSGKCCHTRFNEIINQLKKANA